MRIVLITGCSSGMGLVSALTFARRGDRVYATMRNPSRAEELTATAKAEKLPITLLPLDVASDASVAGAVAQVLAAEGRIDVLVNNAGVGYTGPIEEMKDDMLRAMFETNFFGVLRMLRAVLPTMRAQKSGVIVNISSASVLIRGTTMIGLYQASKQALGIMSEALAAEVEGFGIKVRVLEPGFFATKIGENRRKYETATGTVSAISDSPYRSIQEAAAARIAQGQRNAADPQIVADAVFAAADPQGQMPIHIPVGDDSVALAAARVLLY